MGFNTCAPFWMAAALALVGAIVMTSCLMPGVEGDCTVRNQSSKEVLILPVADVNVSIDVEVGASVEVPPSQQNCYFKNVPSGNQLGPLTLPDSTLLVIVDGVLSGTVDLCPATIDILGNILHLDLHLCLLLGL